MKNTVSRRSFVVGAAATGLVMLSSNQVKANTAVQMQVFKSPYCGYCGYCGCCGAWVEHVQSAGFEVDVFDTEELDSIKKPADDPERRSVVPHGNRWRLHRRRARSGR